LRSEHCAEPQHCDHSGALQCDLNLKPRKPPSAFNRRRAMYCRNWANHSGGT